jgi:hypothetical protein
MVELQVQVELAVAEMLVLPHQQQEVLELLILEAGAVHQIVLAQSAQAAQAAVV